MQEARTELHEAESDLQTAMDELWETAKQNSSHCEGLQTRHDKLREELLMLLNTETDKRQDSIAVVRNSLTADLNQQRADLKMLSDTTEVRSRSLRPYISFQSHAHQARPSCTPHFFTKHALHASYYLQTIQRSVRWSS